MKQSIKNVYIISLVLVIIDQFIKLVVSYNMPLNEPSVLIKGFLSIDLVHNTGAAFSILQGGRVFLISIGIVVIALLTLYIKNSEYVDTKKTIVYGLLLGGIIGNLIDRIVHGYVIDYISFTIINYNFPVFNFADICIVVAVVFALIFTIREDLWN